MHRSRLSTFVIDCRTQDVAAAARFWSAALGRKVKDTVDEPGYLELESRENEPILLVQRVDHDSRIHLDIESDDLEAEVKRLEARRTAWSCFALPVSFARDAVGKHGRAPAHRITALPGSVLATGYRSPGGVLMRRRSSPCFPPASRARVPCPPDVAARACRRIEPQCDQPRGCRLVDTVSKR